jgi:hypothetical protein
LNPQNQTGLSDPGDTLTLHPSEDEIFAFLPLFDTLLLTPPIPNTPPTLDNIEELTTSLELSPWLPPNTNSPPLVTTDPLHENIFEVLSEVANILSDFPSQNLAPLSQDAATQTQDSPTNFIPKLMEIVFPCPGQNLYYSNHPASNNNACHPQLNPPNL